MTGTSPKDLHAKDLPKAEAHRKRQAEGDLAGAVAGAMAGDALAAVVKRTRKKA